MKKIIFKEFGEIAEEKKILTRVSKLMADYDVIFANKSSSEIWNSGVEYELYLNLRVRLGKTNKVKISRFKKRESMDFLNPRMDDDLKDIRNMWANFKVSFTYSNAKNVVIDLILKEKDYDLNLIASNIEALIRYDL